MKALLERLAKITESKQLLLRALMWRRALARINLATSCIEVQKPCGSPDEGNP